MDQLHVIVPCVLKIDFHTPFVHAGAGVNIVVNGSLVMKTGVMVLKTRAVLRVGKSSDVSEVVLDVIANALPAQCLYERWLQERRSSLRATRQGS